MKMLAPATVTSDGPLYESTYLESFGRVSSFPFWICVSAIAVCGMTVAYLRLGNPALATFALLGLCIGFVPAAMRLIYSILSHWMHHIPDFIRNDNDISPDCRRWTKLEFEAFSASPMQWRVGLFIAVLSLVGYGMSGAFANLPWFVAVFAATVTFVAAFACGVGVGSIFGLARYVWRVGKRYQVRVADHRYGVLSTGTMLLKCYALAAVIWCICTSSVTWTTSPLVPLVSMAIPTVIFFLSSFIICQIPLHDRMVEFKRQRLKELDALLAQLTPNSQEEMTQERQRQIEFCVSEIKRVDNLRQWPFGIGTLSGVVVASVGTVAPQLLQIVIPVVVKAGADSKIFSSHP